MSSSAELPDWTAFAERETPEPGELLSPVAELVAVLQRYRTDLDTARQRGQDAYRESLLALAEQAVLVVQLEVAIEHYAASFAEQGLTKAHRHFRVLKDQMLAAVAATGLEVVRLRGRPYDEVAEAVSIVGWRHHPDFAEEVVAEEKEPLVRYRGAVLRPGRVVMGAPPENATESGDEVDGQMIAVVDESDAVTNATVAVADETVAVADNT